MVQRTLEQVQTDHHLKERFVAWLHAGIRLVNWHVVGYVDEVSVSALEAVCRVAGRADRWASELGPVLGPTWRSLSTCRIDVHCSGVFAMGLLALWCPSLAVVLLPHVAQASQDGDSDVREAAAIAMGKLVTTAPDLAAEALPHVAQALRDGNSDVASYAAETIEKLVAAAPDLAAEALSHVA